MSAACRRFRRQAVGRVLRRRRRPVQLQLHDVLRRAGVDGVRRPVQVHLVGWDPLHRGGQQAHSQCHTKWAVRTENDTRSRSSSPRDQDTFEAEAAAIWRASSCRRYQFPGRFISFFSTNFLPYFFHSVLFSLKISPLGASCFPFPSIFQLTNK